MILQKKILFPVKDKKVTGELLGGTVLSIQGNTILLSKGYTIYNRTDADDWVVYAKIRDYKYQFLAKFKLLRRLLRAEITRYYHFNNGAEICIAKKALYKKGDDGQLHRCFAVKRGSRPLNICEDDNGVLYFGEYFNNLNREAVIIYKSEDAGDSWLAAFTFPAGEINHIHGIYKDPYSSKIWVLTGDREKECMIGYTEDGFETFTEFLRGRQEYRSCVMFFYPDDLIVATDSQYITNKIYSINRVTKAITPLQEVAGSVIYGGQMGRCSYVSTTVEPSAVNKSTSSELWISTDGLCWNKIYEQEKDKLSPALFQFGTIRFPAIGNGASTFGFNGRSLKRIDGCSVLLNLDDWL